MKRGQSSWRESFGYGLAAATLIVAVPLIGDMGNVRADPILLLVAWTYLALAATLAFQDWAVRSPVRVGVLTAAAIGAAWVFHVRASPDGVTSTVVLVLLGLTRTACPASMMASARLP